MGRINLDELQAMLKSGRSQAGCARVMSVSEAAVSKAVIRLKAMELPASMQKLTHKERTFAENLSMGMTPTQSALNAYQCKGNRQVASALGSRMAKEPDIALAVADLMSQEGIPRRRRIQRLATLIESNDLSIVSRALEQSWRLDGSLAPEKHLHVNVDIAPVDLSRYKSYGSAIPADKED